jgi:diamine N-acetyltransferase
MHEFIDATPADIPVIQNIAEKTWWPTYSLILPADQIRFMLDAIYNTKTLKELMLNGQQKFILLTANSQPQAFASFGQKSEEHKIFKLHKIYVLPDNHGKGYGSLLIDEVKKRVLLEGGTTLDLNVNRYNPAKGFYEKLGFIIIKEEDVPIGQYYMNDFVMRLEMVSPRIAASSLDS